MALKNNFVKRDQRQKRDERLLELREKHKIQRAQEDKMQSDDQTRQLFASLQEEWLKKRPWKKLWFNSIFYGFIPAALFVALEWSLIEMTRDAEKGIVFACVYVGIITYFAYFLHFITQKLYKKHMRALGVKESRAVSYLLENEDPATLNSSYLETIKKELCFVNPEAERLLRPADPPPASDTLLRPAGSSDSDETILLRASIPPVN